uniref:PRA1 family protein n=1 Tax=Rhodosorus marinus TaxID=101924 RepID=A0A7S3ABN0_9RHOD|mmetsp:Transcript_864/g.2164  ORF Transcript_864/g.2164 Transcript_864/m.2164 type:complete len:164 (+) Transcript_864:146-637(+)
MTSEYQPLGGDKESGGTPSEAPSTLQQITGKLTKAWASANDEKRSWGEFFAFSKMGVPTLAEVETWGWDNLKAFKGNFLLIFYVVWLIFNVINPVGLLFMVLFLFLSVYLVSSPSPSGLAVFASKVLTVFCVLYFSSKAIIAAAFISLLVSLRLFFFKPVSDF